MGRLQAEVTEVEVPDTFGCILADFRTPGGTGHGDALHTGVDVAGNVCFRIEEDGDLVFGEVAMSGTTFRELSEKILAELDALDSGED